MRLTKKEEAWLSRFRKTMAAAPVSIGKKISAYTIGDDDITIYDLEKFRSHFEKHDEGDEYHCTMVEMADAKIEHINFPFAVEATAG